MQISSLLSAGASVPEALFSIALLFLLLIVILIILLGVLLIVPFYLSANLSKTGPMIQGKFRIAWLGFGVWVSYHFARGVIQRKFGISLFGLTLMKKEHLPQPADNQPAPITREEKKDEKKEEKDNERRKSEVDVDPGSLSNLLSAAPALAGVLRDLLKSIRFQKIYCRLVFGLDDPSETALMSGYLWSLTSALGFLGADILIEPCFEGERLDGEFLAEIRVRLLWIPVAILDALREKEIRSLIRVMIGWD